MRLVVALSGGVDSAVAAGLLKEQGHELIGVTLHLWDAEGTEQVGRCCAPEDREDARRVCDVLGIPHYVLDERDAFRQHVVEPFLTDYRSGRTPSPCVHCNRTVKLAGLVEVAGRFGASHVATGHYARILPGPGGPQLLAGRDRSKDQSYFLFGLSRRVRERLIFPLGALTKDQARAEARRLGLPNAAKPDSQELCFVPDGDVAGFVRARRGPGTPGVMTDARGRVLGRHEGIEAFTVGQRRGLGLSGGPPRYVLQIVPSDDQVVVGPAEELLATSLRVPEASWLGPRPQEPFDAQVRIRYRHRPAPGRVRPDGSGFEVVFAEPQRAITPGQAAVVYMGEEVLGGGLIA